MIRPSKAVMLSVLFVIGITVSFFLSPLPIGAQFPRRETGQAKPNTELRAFWVDAFNPGLKTPQQISQLVADVQRANGNVIIAQVRRRGDAFYNSSIEPRNNDPDLARNFDPLQDLITKAHAVGIEVHAWLVTFPVMKSGGNLSPSHVWLKHGPQAPGRENWAMLTYQGGSEGYLDPGHPDAVDYTISVYLDVLKRYDVDGLQLDYVRYGGADWGYNPTSVARFNRQMGRTGTPNPQDSAWKQWRRDQVTNLVRKLYIESLAIKPQVKISAATIAWGKAPESPQGWYNTEAYQTVLQDWRGWLEEGIVDIVMPMTYHREYSPQQKLWYDRWMEFTKDHQYGRYSLLGPGIYLNYIEDSLGQIRRAGQPSVKGNYAKGVALYSYASTNVYSNPDLRPQRGAGVPRQPWKFISESNQWFYRALSQPSQYRDGATGRMVATQPVWPTPVGVPDFPWKSSAKTGFLAGQLGVCTPTCDSVVLTLQPMGSQGQLRTLRTDGKGWFGSVELTPGDYSLRVNGMNLQRTVNILPGQVTRVNLS